MIRITLTLTGALTALAFSAATVHASPDAPTPIGDPFNLTDCCVTGPWGALEDQYYQDFSVPNDPAQTFEGLVRLDTPFFGFSGIRSDYNVYVEQDISGNVPIGEQYNELLFDTPGFDTYPFAMVYSTIGGTPEAAFTTPFGDLNFPTWFVELLGPSFFEPSFYTEAPLLNATMAAADLPALALSAATDPPGAPTPIAGTDSPITETSGPWFEQLQYSQDFSVFNDPAATFEGVVRLDTNGFGLDDHNVYVEQVISGNVAVGEQYNAFTFFDNWGEVYNDIGGTPEAFYLTPFGDIDLPTWFVETVGPTFFEPGAPWLAGL